MFVYQIAYFGLRRHCFLFCPGAFSCARGRGARRGPTFTSQRQWGPQPRSEGRALGLQSSKSRILENDQVETFRPDTASQLSCKTCRTTVCYLHRFQGSRLLRRITGNAHSTHHAGDSIDPTNLTTNEANINLRAAVVVDTMLHTSMQLDLGCVRQSYDASKMACAFYMRTSM